MAIAIICTGTELLKGCATNTNLAFLGQELMKSGMPPVLEMTVGDHPAELVQAMGTALKCADTLVITGGLGPTADDISLDVAARFFGVELHEDPGLHDKITGFWGRHHPGRCPKNQYRQARVPENGSILPNPVGSASGIEFHPVYGGVQRHIFLLPGPPHEFEPMAHDYLVPQLEKCAGEKLYTRGFLARGGESTVFRLAAEAVAEFEVEVASAAGAGATRIFLSGNDVSQVDSALAAAQQKMADLALGPDKFDMAEEVIGLLRRKNLLLGCAESCTGGLLASRFVSFAGVSDVFAGSVTSYSNEVKKKLLSVPDEVLSQYGAVSSECALLMAQNCCKALDCDCAVSTTGIAGPDGGSAEKPVGLVYVAVCCCGKSAVKELRMRGNRRSIRERAVEMAVGLLYEQLIAE